MQPVSNAPLPGLCFGPWISLPAGLCSVSTAFKELTMWSISVETRPPRKTSSNLNGFADLNILYCKALAIWPLPLVRSLFVTGDKTLTSLATCSRQRNGWISNRTTEWLCGMEQRYTVEQSFHANKTYQRPTWSIQCSITTVQNHYYCLQY